VESRTERAGRFEPLRFVGEGKRVFLGLVTSEPRELEGPDLLIRGIGEPAK